MTNGTMFMRDHVAQSNFLWSWSSHPWLPFYHKTFNMQSVTNGHLIYAGPCFLTEVFNFSKSILLHNSVILLNKTCFAVDRFEVLVREVISSLSITYYAIPRRCSYFVIVIVRGDAILHNLNCYRPIFGFQVTNAKTKRCCRRDRSNL